MTDKNDGGSAFPHVATIEDTAGISLRDWFAGQALASVYREANPDEGFNSIAEHAYLMADAMLEARK